MSSNSDGIYETCWSWCIYLISLLIAVIAVTGLDFDPRRLSGQYPFASRAPRCYLMPRVTILSQVDTYHKTYNPIENIYVNATITIIYYFVVLII